MKEQGNTQHSLLKILIALLLLAAAFFGYRHFFPARVVTVGFIYDNDETAPYSYNFYLAQETVQKTYQDKVRTGGRKMRYYFYQQLRKHPRPGSQVSPYPVLPGVFRPGTQRSPG